MATKLQPQDIDTTQTFVLSASQFGDGAVGAPSITFSTAPTTGIYLTGTGSTRFSSLGVNVFRTHGGGAEVVTGALIAPNGTAAAPSLSFTNDQTTGAFLTAGGLGLSVGGTKIIDLRTTGIQNINGTLGNPSYTFASDPDTGIFGDGSNSIRFTAGGVQQCKIDSTTFQVINSGFQIQADNGTAAAPGVTFAGDADTGMYHVGTNNIGLAVNGAVSMTLGTTQQEFYINGTKIAEFNGSRLRPETDNSIQLGSTTQGWKNIYIGDGTVSLPAISFSADNDTGIYRAATNDLGLVAGGVLVVEVAATKAIFSQPVLIADGSVSTPSLNFGSDQDTGIYHFGANNIGFAAGGINTMQITSDAIYPLFHVRNINGTAANPAYTFDAFPTTGLFTNGTTSLRVAVGGTQMFSIDTASINLETQVYLGGDGSAAAPFIAFSTDHDTGIYRGGTNRVNISCGAQAVAVFDGDVGNANQLAINVANGNNPVFALGLANTASGSVPLADCRAAISVNDGNAGDPYILWAIGGPTRYWTLGIDNSNSDCMLFSTTAGGTAKPGTGDVLLIAPNCLQILDGTSSVPALTFINDPDTGVFRNASNQMQFVGGATPILTLGTGGASVLATVAGDFSCNRILPNADNTYTFGSAGVRWTTIFATTGTINTSHSSTKQNIVEIDVDNVEIPQGVEFDRDGRRHIGYLNDSLPDLARPYDEKGNLAPTQNYENAVIGILCAKLRKAFEEIENLKALIQK